MTRKCPDNERAKLDYFTFLRHSGGRDAKTIHQVEKALLRFEEFTRFANFKTFGQKQAMAYKDHLMQLELSKATVVSAVKALQKFLAWLGTQNGYRSRVRPADIDYLNLPEKYVRAAKAPADKAYPSLPLIEKVVEGMPCETAVEKRDRALLAFLALTGIRDGALITLRLRHFDTNRMLIIQDPREVDTKFGKRIDTFVLPLSEQMENILLEWVRYLREELLFTDHDPLFPKTLNKHDRQRGFVKDRLAAEHWTKTSPVRKIVRRAFLSAGQRSHSPHRFRDTIVSEMYRRGLDVSVCKAWSQNLGHEGAMTTLTSYGRLSLEEQGRLIRRKG